MYKEFMFGRFLVSMSENWSQWFSNGYNWREFNFVKFYYEDEGIMGQVEFDIAFLGLSVRILYVYNPEAEMRLELQRRIKEMLE